MAIDLSGKTVFITGAGGRLGITYIDQLTNLGAIVIATELEGDRFDYLAQRYAGNKNVFLYTLDVCQEFQVENIFKKMLLDGLLPNVFINNAAVTGELLMEEGRSFPDLANTSLADWNTTVEVNLTGAFLVARQIDRDIIGRYPVSLINISTMYALKGPHHSIYEDMPFKSFCAYSASKAGIHGLTLWLASYWAAQGGNVNSLAPGAVNNSHSDLFKSRVGELIMKGKMAEPKQISDVIAFMCSDLSSYMTGQMINVDGGFSGW